MKMQPLVLAAVMTATLALFGCQSSLMTSLTLGQKGSLAVTIEGAQRSTQAKLTDIDHITVKVETQKATESQTLNAAALTNGGASASVTFAELDPCTATVSVEAFSATESIGLASASAPVMPLQITHATINLVLNPTIINTGNLDMGISIQNGPVVRVTPAPLHD